MRIISGTFKGRRLASVQGMQTRPTSDRVRESLFNILGARPRDAQVLDLFAGTGALGIEALSRGARSAVFVEKARPALAILNKNIQHCGLQSRARVIQWDILKNLNCLQALSATFELVFMDPPYQRGMPALVLAHLTRSSALAPGALIVVEHDSDDILEQVPAVLTLDDARRYGRTQLSFYSFDS